MATHRVAVLHAPETLRTLAAEDAEEPAPETAPSGAE